MFFICGKLNLAELGQSLRFPASMMAKLPYSIAARIVKVQHPEPGIGVVSEKKMVPAQRPGQQPQSTDGLQRFRKGTLDVHLDHRHLDNVANRVAFCTVTAALFLGSTIVLSREIPPISTRQVGSSSFSAGYTFCRRRV